ncbi:MAG: hypothetical protein KY469_06230 [Actinobacteria bacterium]|nr:hypothetical protein [Actinomycetota bacterium]
MRRCGRCGESKPFGEFNWRRREKGQRDNYCRPCRAEYKQEHYAANKQQYVRNATRRKRRELERRMVWLVDYLRGHPCVDCGETDPVVLEFDHLGPKRWDINKGLRDHRWEDVLAEIAKGEVVCANCHRRRTAERGGFLRAAVAQR